MGSPVLTLVLPGEAQSVPALMGSALGWLPTRSVSSTSGDSTKCRGSWGGKVWVNLLGGNQEVVAALGVPQGTQPLIDSWNTG